MSEPEVLSKSFRAFLLGVEDVVGRAAMPGVLERARLAQYIDNYPPANGEPGGHLHRYISQINQVLQDTFGARAARSIHERVGRAQAAAMMAQDAPMMAAVKVGLCLAPERVKVKFVLERAAREIGARLNPSPRVFDAKTVYYYEDPMCPYCDGWRSSAPVCSTVIGFLKQVLHQLAGIDGVIIEEIRCCAKGDASCLFEITVPGGE